MSTEESIKKATEDATRAITEASENISKQPSQIVANSKLEGVIKVFHGKINTRAVELKKSTEFISDPETKKYILGQADAYSWCVQEMLRLVASA